MFDWNIFRQDPSDYMVERNVASVLVRNILQCSEQTWPDQRVVAAAMLQSQLISTSAGGWRWRWCRDRQYLLLTTPPHHLSGW